MPKLSVWAVRLSLIHFAAGVVMGSALLAGKAVGLPPWLWALRPAHVEMLLFGFMVQLVVGVGYWILPRAPVRVGERLMRLSLVLLNAGVLFVAGGALLSDGPALPAAGRMLEALAVALFAVHVWPRVRAAKQAQ